MFKTLKLFLLREEEPSSTSGGDFRRPLTIFSGDLCLEAHRFAIAEGRHVSFKIRCLQTATWHLGDDLKWSPSESRSLFKILKNWDVVSSSRPAVFPILHFDGELSTLLNLEFLNLEVLNILKHNSWGTRDQHRATILRIIWDGGR